jgi:hypothetical protein
MNSILKMEDLDDGMRKSSDLLDKAIGHFVSIDGECENNESYSDVCAEFGSACHLLKTATIGIAVALFFGFLMYWNDIMALYIEFTLFLIQLVFAIDKFPGFRLDTRSYLSGPAVTATLTETKLVRVNNACDILKKSRYVVEYMVHNEDGSFMTIRKTLQPGIFDRELIDGEIFDTSFVTDLVRQEGKPFSAVPRKLVERHTKREYRWILYLMPILVVTINAIIFNLFLSYRDLAFLSRVRGSHYHPLTHIYIVFGVLYTIILVPLAHGTRRWLHYVHNGGEVVGAGAK